MLPSQGELPAVCKLIQHPACVQAVPSLCNSLPCLLHTASRHSCSITSLKPPRSFLAESDPPSKGIHWVFWLPLTASPDIAQACFTLPLAIKGRRVGGSHLWAKSGRRLFGFFFFFSLNGPGAKNSFYIFKWLGDKNEKEISYVKII